MEMVTFFGLGGAVVFLGSTKAHTLRMKGVRGIEESVSGERWLLSVASQQAQELRIATPQLAVYDSEKMVSFSTGSSKNRACIVISSGLLTRMTNQEITAVIAHEMSHIANGDRVTQALLQGFYSTLLVPAIQQFERSMRPLASLKLPLIRSYTGAPRWKRLISGHAKPSVLDPEEDAYFLYELVSVCMNMRMGFTPLLMLCWFSRWREFRADAQSAAMVGKHNMIAVLKRLETNAIDDELDDARILPFGICVLRKSRWAQLRHPLLEARTAKLNKGKEGSLLIN